MRTRVPFVTALLLVLAISSACERNVRIRDALDQSSPADPLSGDTVPPLITTFSVPATSVSPTVTGIALDASDNVGVVGFYLSHVPATPSASATGWSDVSPTSYEFSGFAIPVPTTRTLHAWVKDAAGNLSSARTATVTISIPDTAGPTITAFSVPPNAISTIVPVNDFSATDNLSVTGYLITETSSAPLVTASGWSSTPPISYTFLGIPQGVPTSKTLYAWAKDAAGNLSSGIAAATNITLPLNIPDGAHPRIWLTSAEMARLTAKRDTNDPTWTSLLTWCDSHVNDAGFNVDPIDQSKLDLTNWGGNNNYTMGYRMGGFNMHLMNYALAYQVLKAPGSGQNLPKAATFASRAKTLMIDGIATALRAGEENNGLKAVRVGTLHDITINASEASALGIGTAGYKQGYSSRYLASVPIAYDWIYETLSPPDKEVLLKMMLRWFDWIRGTRSAYNNGVLKDGIRYYEDKDGNCTGSDNCTTLSGVTTRGFDFGNMSGNFNGGHTYLMSLIPVALYGDHPDVAQYLDYFRQYLASTVVDQLESDLKQSGGDSVEGWNYGGSFLRTVLGLYGYYTATGDQTIVSMTWPSALVNAMLHRVGANLLDVPFYGYWTGIPMGVNRQAMALPFIAIEQRLRPSSDLSKVGQHYLKHVNFTDTIDLWQPMLWARADIPELAPEVLPLTHLAKGNGYFTSRSSWTDPNTVHLAVRLEGKNSASHEGYDEGDLSLQRGADRLLTHQNSVGDAPPAVSFNTIVFNNQSHHANLTLLKPAIDRTETGSNYAYVSGDITNAWKRQYSADRVALFRRSVLHVLPGLVVTHDTTQSNSALGNLKEWYTQYIANPTTNADTISATVGNSKIFVKVLHPSGGTFTTTNPSPGYYRVKYVPAIQQEYEQFLHVIEATSSASAQTPSAAVLVTSGTVRGVQAGNVVAMFTSSQDGSSPLGSFSYQYSSAAPTTHYLTDLAPNTKYDVATTGGALTCTPADSGAYTVSANGLLVLSVSETGTVTQIR